MKFGIITENLQERADYLEKVIDRTADRLSLLQEEIADYEKHLEELRQERKEIIVALELLEEA